VRILIAEDDNVSRLIAEAALRKLGHHVVVAKDGAHAWALFSGAEFDAIICDRQMPVLDGDELCRRIRAHPTSTYPYFIFLTGLSEKKAALDGMGAGADDYLVKPLKIDELAGRLIVAERIAALHRQLSDQRAELERLNLMLHDQSRHDPLTGAGTRRKLDEDAAAIFERASRYGERYCAVMCDIDYFKQYNDTYGHPTGDTALRRVAETIQLCCRSGDAVYRYGGEEFLILMRSESVAAAAAAAERCRAAVEALNIEHSASPFDRITLSMGVAALDPAKLELADCLAQADALLYEAKRAGRNRVVSLHADRSGSGATPIVGCSGASASGDPGALCRSSG